LKVSLHAAVATESSSQDCNVYLFQITATDSVHRI
jgi:hypothetical protein